MTSKQDPFILEATWRTDVPYEQGLSIRHPKTVHIIPQSHIDLVWYWGPDESVRMILSTFRGHAEKLEANPEFTYAQSQPVAYEVVLQHDPGLFRRIQDLVRKGQWELVGGEWCEADAVLPGPEGRLRQFSFGQRFFQAHFGRTAAVAWSPDSFTLYPNSMPQILRQAKIRYFVHKRPREMYGSYPILPYVWRGIDGSTVIGYRSNNKGPGLPVLAEGIPVTAEKGDTAVIAERFEEEGLTHLWAPMGVGDVGGVNSYDTPSSSDLLSVVYSTPSRYFSSLLQEVDPEQLPVLSGSSAPVFMGSLMTWAHVKTLLRAAENRLLEAEGVMGMAKALGLEADVRMLDPAWKRLLYYQFHDSAAGTGTDPIREIMEHQLVQAEMEASEALALHMRQIAESVRYEGTLGVPLVVANPLGWTRSDSVEARIDLPRGLRSLVPEDLSIVRQLTIDCREFVPADDVELEAVDEEGNTVPVMVARYGVLQKIHVAHIRFWAADIPGFGYKTYYLRARPRSAPGLSQRNGTYSSGRLEAKIDFTGGGISHLTFTDVPGLDFSAVDEPLGALRIVHTGDYPIDYRKELRAWHTGFTGEEDCLAPVRHEVKTFSGGRQAVIFHYEYGDSRFEQEFLMEPGVPHIEVTLSGEWQEVEKYLKIQFGLSGTSDQTAFADLAYGFTEVLPEDMEYPMQYFCGVRDESKALLVLNNSRYGCRWKDRRLSISAIRCATYPAPISDRGPFGMSYRIAAAVIADSTWTREIFAQGFGFNRRFLSYAPSWSSNERPTGWALLEDEPELALGTALKPADDGSGLIIRTFNPGDDPICDRLIPAAERPLWEESTYLENAPEERREVSEPLGWRPWEIKTLSVDIR